MGMTCVDSGQFAGREGNSVQRVTCTFDTNPGTAVALIPQTVMTAMGEKYIYTFATAPGTTGPTDDCDLAIADSRGVTILSASGNGANVIKNATSVGPFYGDGPTAGSTKHFPKAHEDVPWTITVTNNAVNSSSFILYMEVSP